MPRKKKPQPKQRVIFKDKHGHFVKSEDRYKEAVTAQVLRRGRYVTVIDQSTITPHKLAQVTNRVEFESLPPAFEAIRTITAPKRGKQKTWELAKEITKTKGIRDKLIKITVTWKPKKRKKATRRVKRRKESFYHKVPAKKKVNYTIFQKLKELTEGVKLPFWYDIQDEDLEELENDIANIDEIEIEEVM